MAASRQVSKSSATVKGVDVSSYQGEIDWVALEATGIDFVFVKATEGATLIDPFFSKNLAGARLVGIPVSAYHFFHPFDTVQSQVDNFVKAVGSIQPGDLPPVLDVETPSEWTNISLHTRASIVQEWLTAVQAALGMNPIVYMSSSFAEVLGSPSFLADYPLYVAEITPADTPKVPPVFPRWTFWQYEIGSIAGIAGPVDLDIFNGSVEQLNKFRKTAAAPPPVSGSLLVRMWRWLTK